LQFETYAYKDLKKLLKDNEVNLDPKVLVPFILKLNQCLNGIELKMNMSNVDERVIFTAEIGNFMREIPYKG
jgi:hypothetical protein